MSRGGLHGGSEPPERRGLAPQSAAVVAEPLGACRRFAPDSEGGQASGEALTRCGEIMRLIYRIQGLLVGGRQLGVERLAQRARELSGEGHGLPHLPSLGHQGPPPPGHAACGWMPRRASAGRRWGIRSWRHVRRRRFRLSQRPERCCPTSQATKSGGREEGRVSLVETAQPATRDGSEEDGQGNP